MGAAASFTKDRLTADEARQLAGDHWNPELFDQFKGDDGCVSMDQLRALHATEKGKRGLDAPLSGKKVAAATTSKTGKKEATLKKDVDTTLDQLKAVLATKESKDDEDTSVLGTRALAVALQHTRTRMMHLWCERFPADPLPAHESGMSTALLLFEGRCVVLLRRGIR